MAKNSANIHSYGDTLQMVATAALGVTPPTAPLPAALPAAWYDVGWLSDAGIVEAQTQQETKKYGWQGGAIVKVLRSQSEHTFTFDCLEENAVTMGLLRPGSTTTTTGATAEVQTITITGTPTGGTFTLTIPGYGSTATLAYNITTALLATALTTLFGATVAVSGTAGTSYVCTFPANAGNVPTMTAAGAFTGGTTPTITVATTTPGVNGINTTGVGPYTSQNMRQWSIDLIDGTVHKRLYIPTGEAVVNGTTTYIASDDAIYQFVVNCYADSAGKFFYDLNDNATVAAGLGLFA